ncbi:tetratricopeptide repeat protein [Flammeovirga aprica]|uniref:Tetratricopeptide repeat protein n=1 Tax=Flammeovirga aprica JL-4 TaxID=694437 RepID=A0A7X9RVV9_9BACT|nr:tetratricopeptide repeat protein [Flammeovirga aprica]NME69664.1 tetratricopeptide repeat protein [Flammeovirga aprica JL-4]
MINCLKKRFKILILLLYTFPFVPSFAQESLYFSDEVKLFNKGIVLYNENNFSAARRYLSRFQQKHCGEDEKCIETEYYIAVCNLELQHPDAERQIVDFVNRYPVHPFSSKAYKVLGGYYFDKGEYAKALEAFNKNPLFDFFDDDDVKVAYQAAYANFDQGKTEEANKLFQILKRGTHAYALKASYYAGYIEFDQGNFEEAITDLEKSTTDPKIRSHAYALLPIAYYKTGQENKMLEMVNEAKESGIHLPPDAFLFTGKVYYKKHDYEKALFYFDAYMSEVPVQAIDRVTAYQIGFSKFKVKLYHEAIQPLSIAADDKDELAQVASYDLGVTSLSIGEKDKALLAFEQSRYLTFNKELQELAAYNYIKVLFDVGLYTQVPDAFDFFVAYFPNSDKKDEVDHLLQVAYVNSGDYTKALEMFDKLTYVNVDTRRAYQEAAFNKSVENANDDDWRGAIEYLLKSQRFPISDDLLNASNYWLGEAYSFLEVYDSAVMSYDKVPESSQFYVPSLFGKGYANYADEEYELAVNDLTNYINKGRNIESREKIGEAMLRRADCYFGMQNYKVAIRSYNMAISSGVEELDYVNYQMAQNYKALGQLDNAIRLYQKVGNDYKSSTFAPLAYYQIGLIYAEEDRNAEAIKSFTQIINRYENTEVYIPSLAKRALCYQLEGDMSLSERDYKEVIDTDPTSQYAESSITALQDINSSGYAVSEISNYQTKFREANPESTATLRGDYEVAIQPYQNKDYDRAIITLQQFIDSSPYSQYTDDAAFALGVAYKFKNEKDKAITAFQIVQKMPTKEKALRYIGELQLQTAKFEDAIVSFVELEKIATRKSTSWAVYVGLMKANYEVKDYGATLAYANKIIENNVKRSLLEAELYIAKVHLQEGKFNESLTLFDEVAQKASSKIGAEAQYYVGYTLRAQALKSETNKEVLKKGLDTSTTALIDVQKRFASYTEWTSKAYLLIAENYISLEDFYQAKATLESVYNFAASPEDKALAKKRISELEELKENASNQQPTN